MTKGNRYAMMAAMVLWVLGAAALSLLWAQGHGHLSDSLDGLGVLILPLLIAFLPGPLLLMLIFPHHMYVAMVTGFGLNFPIYWVFFRGLLKLIFRYERKSEGR